MRSDRLLPAYRYCSCTHPGREEVYNDDGGGHGDDDDDHAARSRRQRRHTVGIDDASNEADAKFSELNSRTVEVRSMDSCDVAHKNLPVEADPCVA
jgi:hypothetical protein